MKETEIIGILIYFFSQRSRWIWDGKNGMISISYNNYLFSMLLELPPKTIGINDSNIPTKIQKAKMLKADYEFRYNSKK